MKRACFLDRDGVLNAVTVKHGKPYPPSTFEEFQILPGVAQALMLLRKAGFLSIVVTNQPDVGRGLQKKEIVERMHRKLVEALLVDDLLVCFDETSSCYKPKPGMLLEAAQKYNIDLSASYMIGDRWRDIGAGKAAGCTTILIDYSYQESLRDLPDFTCSSLLEGVEILLTVNKRRSENVEKFSNQNLRGQC